MEEEKNIVSRYKKGDASAFDTLYFSYSKKLYYFVMGLLKDQTIAEEIIQEVFVKLWEKRDKVNADLNFENYIFMIAYNSVRKYFRDKSLESRILANMSAITPEEINSTESIVIYNDLLSLVNEAIEKMPSQRKRVYKLSRHDGMSIQDISKKLNISKRTAENHLSRALKYLKEEIANISLLTSLFFHLFCN